MNTTAIKIVLDTNVLIASIGKLSPIRWIFDDILNGRFILCVSNEILLEYQEILSRKTTAEIGDNLTNFLCTYPYVQLVNIHYHWQMISIDEDDNKYVDCAIAAGAFCIVSNDKHFKSVKNIDFPPLQVYNTDEFTTLFGVTHH